jgi:uncharacterized membrane protein (DUF2068 family)
MGIPARYSLAVPPRRALDMVQIPARPEEAEAAGNSSKTLPPPLPDRHIKGEGKKRHWCLTVWLIIIMVGSAANAFGRLSICLQVNETICAALAIQYIPWPSWLVWLSAIASVFSLLNLICAIALWKWNKWGFWGYCVSSLILVVVNSVVSISQGAPIGSGITVNLALALIGVVILYGVLHIGKENKGWVQLG